MRTTMGFWFLALVFLCAAPAAAVDRTFVPASGDWFTDANWNPAGVPTAADTAIIPSGRSAQLNAAATVAGLTISGGTLTGTGALTVTGQAVWTSGTMSGSGTTNAEGGLEITGFVNLNGRTLNNSGTAVMSGSGNMNPSNSAVLNNLAGGVFEIRNDNGVSSGGTVNNAGTWRRALSSGVATIGSTFNSTGAVEVDAGTLSLTGGGSGSGTFEAAGGVLRFGGGTYTMTAASSLVGNLAVTSGTLNVAGSYAAASTALSSGTLNVTSMGGGTTATLNQTSGTLAGTTPLTVTGTMQWSGGTQSGNTATNADGGLEITGFVSLSGRTLNNAGTGVMNGSGNMNPSNNAVVNNLAAAVFEIQNDNGVSSGGTVNNAGTWRRALSSGVATIGSTFNSTGAVEVDTGTLSLTGGGSGSGTFEAAGGVLRVAGGTYTMTAASSFMGNLAVTNGTLNVAGGYAASLTALSSGTLNITSMGGGTTATLNQTSGTLAGTTPLTVTGAMEWSGGTQSGNTATNAAGGLEITGFVNLSGRTLNNAGTAVMNGSGNMNPSNNAVVNNLAEAVFEIQNDNGVSSGGTVNNAGTWRRALSSGVATIGSTFNSTGAVEVDTGTLSLTGGGSGSGTFEAAGGVLRVAGGTYTMAAASSLVGNLAVTSGTLNVAGSYAAASTILSFGTLNITSMGGGTTATLTQSGGTLAGTTPLTVSGAFQWSGGTQSGPTSTNAQGGIEITSFVILSERTLNNAGTAVMNGSGNMNPSNNAVVNNLAGATFDIQNDNGISSGGAVSNAGTWRRSMSSGLSTIASPFTNTGVVEAVSGTLRFTAAFTQTAGATLLVGGRIASSVAAGLSFQGGRLGGSGTVEGNVSSAGEVAPGLSPGDIEITGTYAQLAGGTLAIEIGGGSAGTQFDRLRVGGAATVTGALDVSLVDGFTPNPGDRFEIMTFASRTGDFSDKGSLTLGGGLGFNEIVTDTSLTLEYAQEICDDGIDNDGNGLTDCFDFKCFGVPPCMGTPTNTPVPTATGTSTSSPTPVSTATSTATATPTDTPLPPPACIGDCGGDLFVTVDEIVLGVNINRGSEPPSACPAFAGASTEELVQAVTNALVGCSGAPTPTPRPTATVGPGPNGEAAARGAAGATTMVANTLGLVPSIVTALINGIQLGGAAATFEAAAVIGGDPTMGGGAGACPAGGTATSSGSFPFVSMTLSDCTVETADGTVTYNGTGSIQLTSFNLSIVAVFRNPLGVETLRAIAMFSGTVSPTLAGSCILTAADLMVTSGSLRAETPDGDEVSVTFQGTRIRITDITFGEDCVPAIYRLTFDGPASLVATGGEPFAVTFVGLRMDVDDSGSGTVFELSGNIDSECFGGTASFSTPTALRVSRDDVCPTAGLISVGFLEGMSRILYGSDMSVSIDSNANGVFDLVLPNCLDPRLLECGGGGGDGAGTGTRWNP